MTGAPIHDLMIGVILGFFIGLIFLKYRRYVERKDMANFLRGSMRLEFLEARIDVFEQRLAARLEKDRGSDC